MGSANIGGLFAALTLDDSQFKQALKDSVASSAVLRIDLDKFGGTVQQLGRELNRVGVSTKEWQGWLNSLRAQGLTSAQAMNVLADSVKRVQDRIVQLDLQKLGTTPRGPSVGGLSADQQRERDFILQNANTKVLAEKKAAEDIVRYEQDKATALRKIDDALRNDRLASARNYANLKKQLVEEAAAAETKAVRDAQAAIEKAERDRFIAYRRQQDVARALQTIGVAATATGAAILGPELFAAKEAAGFQDAMAKSLAVIGLVSDALQGTLATAARTAAKQTGLAAKDIASDYAIMSKGGLQAAEMLELVGKFSQFAVANQVPLHDSTKQLLTVMEAFGMKASDLPRIMDELSKAAPLARSSVDQLATSLEGRAGSALHAANVTLEESIALSIAFARRGYEASAAQTALSQIINRFTALATTHGQVQLIVNGHLMKFHDIVYSSTGAVRPFVQVLNDMNAAFSHGTPEAIRTAFNDISMGTTRGVDAVKALVAAAPEVASLTREITNSGNAMGALFGAQLKSPLVQMEILKRQLDDIAISLGGPVVGALQGLVHALDPVLKGIASLTQKFSELPPQVQTFIAGSGLVAGAGATMAGGLLVAASAVVRLGADIALLQSSGKLTNFITLLTNIGTKAGLITTALIATYLAAQKLAELGDTDLDKRNAGQKSLHTASDAEIAEDARKRAEYEADIQAKAAATAASKLRRISDDQAADAKAAEKALKAKLQLDNLKENISKLADDLANEQRKISDSQYLIVSDYIQNLAKMLDAHVDPRIIGEKLRIARDQLTNFSRSSAIDAKDEADAISKAHVLYEAQLQVEHALEATERERVSWGTKMAEAEHKITTETERQLALAAKELNQTPVGTQLKREGVPDSFVEAVQRNLEIQKIFKDMGAVSQEALDGASRQAQYFYDQLVKLGVGGYDLKVALVKLWEAQAAAAHVSADQIDSRYRQLSQEIQNSVQAGNKAWQRQIQEVGRGLQGIFRDVANGLVNLIPIFGNDGKDPLSALTTSLRGAYEKLAAYSDPKQALIKLVDSIKMAGSASQANAIAVKYFGDTAGPLLAKDIRSGAISAGDLSKAIDKATVSTQDFANASNTSVSAFTQLWQKAVKDIVALIAKQMIELGFKALIDWMFKVGKASSSMADDVVAAAKKIAQWIGIMSKPAATAGQVAAQVGGTAASTVSTVGGAIDDAAGPVTTGVGAASSGAGSAAGSASSFLNVFSAVTGAVTAISSVIGNFQMAGMNKSLDLIENYTRWLKIGLVEQGDSLLNDSHVIRNTLTDFMKFNWDVLAKYLFQINVDLDKIAGGGMALAGGGGGNIYIETLTVQSSNPADLVSQLKQLRVVKG